VINCFSDNARSLLCAFLASMLLAGAAVARADGPGGYPAKPVTIVVPFAPGGATDIIGRLLADELKKRWGRSIIVENRAGAGGGIGTEYVAHARGDGYTLLLGTQTALSVNPTLLKKTGYKVDSDFAPVTLLATTPLVLLASNQSGLTSVQDMVKALKSKPEALAYGTSGNGTSQHLTTEMFLGRIGAKAVHVPYKGSGQSLIDLAGGQIAFQFDNMTTALALAKGGRAHALAVTSATRSELAPELPTMAEAGLPGFEALTWLGLVAPAETPEEIVNYLSSEAAAVLNTAEVKSRLATQGFAPKTSKPAEFRRFIQDETAKFAAIIRQNNISAE
jgi:tripartite-type tricarboxylate transporter receptor subunit TctC